MIMHKHRNAVGLVMVFALILAGSAVPAGAGFYWGGNGMQVIDSGTIANGAIYMQSVSAWPAYGNASGGYSCQFTNTPASDSIVSSRLLVAIYGGSKDYTCTLTATVNGAATSVTLGGAADSNPEFTAGQTNVYGSTSSGAWVVSIPVAAANLASGAADNVNITITNKSGNFDGRIVYSSLWEVYQQASLKNTFQYAIAEGSGDIYSTTPGTAQTPTVSSRSVDMGGFNVANLETAKLDTLYTYVHSGQDNHLYLNGSLVGGDPAVSSGSTYAAVQAGFDVTSELSSSDNQVKFSVDPADGVASSGTSVLRPQVAILEATSAATPEPATLGLLAVGALGLIRRRQNA
jgi:MYXO-CTERM domain-containing protein